MRKFSPEPESFFRQFPRTYAGVRSICERRLSQFGPYFVLKICDYMDRCLTMPIQSYAGLERNLPTEPAWAVKLMFHGKLVPVVFMKLCREAATWGILAPPLFDRPVGPAEIETSLCGWKTVKYKGNWMGADILDKREALQGYGDKAQKMINMMPPLVPKGTFECEL